MHVQEEPFTSMEMAAIISAVRAVMEDDPGDDAIGRPYVVYLASALKKLERMYIQ